MRKPIAYLLLILTGFNLFGFYALFFIKQTDIKEEMMQKISSLAQTDEIEVLSFSNDQFKALQIDNDGKELRFNGRLYDIVSTQQQGSRIQVTVEYDVKETLLVNKFTAGLQQQQKDQYNHPLKALLNYLQQIYFSDSSIGLLHFNCSDRLVSICPPVAKLMLSQYKNGVFVPPPQFIVA